MKSTSNLLRYLPRGLPARLYLAFAVLALGPALLAGLFGQFSAGRALENAALEQLQSEAAQRADALGRFLEGLGAELGTVAAGAALRELVDSAGQPKGPPPGTRGRIEADFGAFARTHPELARVRLIGIDGRELIRVERRGKALVALPDAELEPTVGDDYLRDALALRPGRRYLSPLGRERDGAQRPVLHFASPVSNAQGAVPAVVVADLPAETLQRDFQPGGRTSFDEALLLDRSGTLLRWAPAARESPFEMLPVARQTTLARELLDESTRGRLGSARSGGRAVGYAAVEAGAATVTAATAPLRWNLVLVYPGRLLSAAGSKLSLLYWVLALALAASAAGGLLVIRRLLRPLDELDRQSRAIAEEDLGKRVDLKAPPEIARIGARFNRMADHYDELEQREARRAAELERGIVALKAESANTRSKLECLLAGGSEGLLLTDAEGHVEVVNQAACRLLGFERAALVGCDLAQRWPPAAEWLDPSGAGVHKVLHQGSELDVAVTPLADAQGRLARFLVCVGDGGVQRRQIDELRELDRQAFRSERRMLVGELAQGIGQRIGRSLETVRTALPALAADAAAEKDRRVFLAALELEGKRLGELLRPVIAGSGARAPDPVEVTLQATLADALLWTRRLAAGHGVAIDSSEVAPDLPALAADPGLLAQALLELVTNGIEATPAGGTLRIAAARDAKRPDRVQIVVADEGEGVAAEFLPRIFEPLVTTRSGRAGLGLALVKRIATLHGAELGIASAPDKGTRFRLSWPVAGAEKENAGRTGDGTTVRVVPGTA